MKPKIRFVFFGSSDFSKYVLDSLKSRGFEPTLSITSSKEILSLDKLQEINADIFIVASFGKILPKELIYMPKWKTLNVHPSLLPRLRGPSPIQGAILGERETGVTIMRIDEEMDHGPIVAQRKVSFEKWPIGYIEAEKILGTEGGNLLADTLEQLVEGKIEEREQNHASATYTKIVRKTDGDITGFEPKLAWKKVLAYEVWPRAYTLYKRRDGKEERIVITEAHLDPEGKLIYDQVIPAGKREMSWEAFLHGGR